MRTCRVLLPAGVGVKQAAQVTLTVRQNGRELEKSVQVPAMRHWTVYIYPHSHVDIGYTNTHKNVEILHKTNILEGIKLAAATKRYPEGARYRWNPEVTWPLERLWQTMPAQRERVLQAIRNGSLCVDAGYVNINTSVCCDEELFHVLQFSREMQQLSGVPIDTFQQMDVPGMSWGLVPVLAQEGVRYIMAWPNSDRAGNTHNGIDQRPFWWVGPDGKSKVLFLQPGGYGNSGSMGKGGATGRPWFGQRHPDKVPSVIKTGHANVDFTGQLTALENAKHPYDFLVLSWSLWDNCPLDADIPDAVKAWNEQHAYPHLVIAGGHEIMQAIETKYGDQLPVVQGDFTEYWTDGLGTAARLTASNRNAKDRLTQAETLWTMLRPGRPAPRGEFDEAWRYIALGSEHTWCAENPSEPFFQDAIWRVKQDYFREAADRSQALLDDALAPATDKSNGALGPAGGPSAGGVAVFNTHSWKHGGLVTLCRAESLRGDRVADEQGRDVPAQRLSTGELVFLASDVPAFASRHYRVVQGACSLAAGCKLNGATMENQQLRVTLDPATGNITHLVSLATGRNFADAKINGGLNAFRWIPANRNDAKADTDVAVSTVESGPLLVELRVLQGHRLSLGQPQRASGGGPALGRDQQRRGQAAAGGQRRHPLRLRFRCSARPHPPGHPLGRDGTGKRPMAASQPQLVRPAALARHLQRLAGRHLVLARHAAGRVRRHDGQHRHRLGRPRPLAPQARTQFHHLLLGDEQPLAHQLPLDPGRSGHLPLPHFPARHVRRRRGQPLRHGAIAAPGTCGRQHRSQNHSAAGY